MVKSNKSKKRKNRKGKGFIKKSARAKKINASTAYDTCSEQLSPFGGLLPLIKFLDLIDFQQMFDFAYRAPTRKPKLGHYSMMVGLLMLLFIGFNRIWHFTYLRLDAMRIFQFEPVTGSQHLLALCQQPRHQPGPVAAPINGRTAPAGLESVRLVLLSRLPGHRHDGRDCFRAPARRSKGAQHQTSR